MKCHKPSISITQAAPDRRGNRIRAILNTVKPGLGPFINYVVINLEIFDTMSSPLVDEHSHLSNPPPEKLRCHFATPPKYRKIITVRN